MTEYCSYGRNMLLSSLDDETENMVSFPAVLAAIQQSAESALSPGDRYEVRMVRTLCGSAIAWYSVPELFLLFPAWEDFICHDYSSALLEGFQPLNGYYLLARGTVRPGPPRPRRMSFPVGDDDPAISFLEDDPDA